MRVTRVEPWGGSLSGCETTQSVAHPRQFYERTPCSVVPDWPSVLRRVAGRFLRWGPPGGGGGRLCV